MRTLALLIFVVVAAALVALPGRAAEEGSGPEAAPLMMADGCVGDGCERVGAPAAGGAASEAEAGVLPRMDDQTKDLLAIAALVCVLLASFVLNARASRRPKRRPRPAPGAAKGRARRPPPRGRATRAESDTPAPL